MKINKKTIGLIVSGVLWLLQNLGWLPTAADATGLSVDTKAVGE